MSRGLSPIITSGPRASAVIWVPDQVRGDEDGGGMEASPRRVMPDLIRHPCDGARRRGNSPQTENPPELRRFDPAASTFLPVGVSVHLAPCSVPRPSATSSSRYGSVGSGGGRVERPSRNTRWGVLWGRGWDYSFSVVVGAFVLFV